MSETPKASCQPRLAIAGSTGFVGNSIVHHLSKKFRLRCLTRSKTVIKEREQEKELEWVHCDAHSRSSVEQALQDVDVLIYLIHSMVPTSRLSQASFQDLDLLLADNFSRGCQAQGVKQIIYISGLIPVETELSAHLSSRHEVESTLKKGGVALTTLRCGLIVGPGGSSLRILLNLVRRLPAMLLPSWTLSRTQPIAIGDVVRAVEICLENPQTYVGSFDIGCPDVLTYRQMMATTSRLMGRKVPLIPIKGITTGLSKRWVTTVSGCSMELVGPLVDSLSHEMVVKENPLQDKILLGATSFERAMRESMEADGAPKLNPRQSIRRKDDRNIKMDKRVRSVQRLPLPEGRTALWVMEEYLRWIPRFMGSLVSCEVDSNGRVRFCVKWLQWDLLVLQLNSQEREERLVLRIKGGLLAKVDENQDGRLEFREILGGKYVMAALHDFSPSLPWYLYNLTQAPVHFLVMKAFGRHLARDQEERPS